MCRKIFSCNRDTNFLNRHNLTTTNYIDFIHIELDLALADLDLFGHSKENTYTRLLSLNGAAESTIWHREHSRGLIQQKALK